MCWACGGYAPVRRGLRGGWCMWSPGVACGVCVTVSLCGGGARVRPGGSVRCVRTVPINMSNLFMLNLNYLVDPLPLLVSFVPT